MVPGSHWQSQWHAAMMEGRLVCGHFMSKWIGGVVGAGLPSNLPLREISFMALFADCPKCGARYDIGGVAANQALACKKCGTTFTVAASTAPPSNAPPPPTDSMNDFVAMMRSDSTSTDANEGNGGIAETIARLRGGDWNFEPLFTVGVVMLVFAYMLSVIDGAAVARARAALVELELEFRDDNESLIGELNAADRGVLKAREAVVERENSAAADDERLRGAVDALTKAERARSKKLAEIQRASRLYKLERERDIDRDILSQSIDSDTNGYWYAWLQLPGFVCLFLGSIAYLRCDSRVKRVTASIILTISLCVLVMLHLVPGTLRSQSLFNIGGTRDVTYIEDERGDGSRRPGDFRR